MSEKLCFHKGAAISAVRGQIETAYAHLTMGHKTQAVGMLRMAADTAERNTLGPLGRKLAKQLDATAANPTKENLRASIRASHAAYIAISKSCKA
jgi:hypothetical protein